MITPASAISGAFVLVELVKGKKNTKMMVSEAENVPCTAYSPYKEGSAMVHKDYEKAPSTMK